MSDAEEIPASSGMNVAPVHDLPTRRVDALKVALSLCLCYTLLIAFVRVYIRRNLYGPDDWTAFGATIVAIAQFAAGYAAVGQGLGRTIDVLRESPDLLALNKSNLGAVVLWVFSLFASKCAAIVFMSRFAQPGRHKKEILTLLVVVAILGLGSLLAVIVNCRVVSAIYYWDFPRHVNYCPNPYLRWQIVAAFDAITEFLMLAVPVDLIWSLQMPSKRKVGIITAFYIRTPVLAFTLIRNHYVYLLKSTPDTGLMSRTVFIWQEVELTFSLAAATLMCLKPLVSDFNTSFGLGGEMVRTHAASGYILSNNGNTTKGMGSRMGRLRSYGASSRYGKGSVIEMDSRDLTASDKNHVVVSESSAHNTLRPHPDTRTTTTVSSDYRQYHPNGSGGADDIVVTHRVEQHVHPRHMV
ncbi:MAG: hypothetical protein L6R40_003599 [Gallowayella cf. fulva]|nr:MAG: hypothetical protein L6R40_003599 [Xanthomendoza cf. fulva]